MSRLQDAYVDNTYPSHMAVLSMNLEEPPDFCETHTEKQRYRWRTAHKRFAILDGYLLVSKCRQSANTTRRQVLVVPRHEYRILLADRHAQRHGGVNSTLARLRLDYEINGELTLLARQLHDSCEVCMGAINLSTREIITCIYSYYPGDRLLMDLKMFWNIRGYHYMLVVVDHYTYYSWLFPIPSKEALEVMKCLDIVLAELRTVAHPHFAKTGIDAFLRKDGTKATGVQMLGVQKIEGWEVETVHSDNGTEFKNKLINQYLRARGIDQVHGASYHPQSQGSGT